MDWVVLIMESITKAQRAEKQLLAEGIRCAIYRAPAQLSKSGCAYAVRVKKDRLHRALERLSAAELPVQGIYERTQEGYREVSV